MTKSDISQACGLRARLWLLEQIVQKRHMATTSDNSSLELWEGCLGSGLTEFDRKTFMLRCFYSKKVWDVVRPRVGSLVSAVLVAFVPHVSVAEDVPARDAVTIAATISFSPEWLVHAKEDQRAFMTNLMQQERPIEIDSVPRNRLYELIERGGVDCILSAKETPIKNTVKAQSRIVFLVELFHHKDVDLNELSAVEIGLLAHLPKPEIPLDAELEWYPLRSIDQGVKLLAERRLDVIVADSTRVAMTGNKWIVSSGLPPVRVAKLALICRDTKPLREFVDAFDSSFGLPDDSPENA